MPTSGTRTLVVLRFATCRSSAETTFKDVSVWYSVLPEESAAEFLRYNHWNLGCTRRDERLTFHFAAASRIALLAQALGIQCPR